VEVVGSVLLAGAVGLISPVDADFLEKSGTVSEFLQDLITFVTSSLSP
jgi:hypothetical protein